VPWASMQAVRPAGAKPKVRMPVPEEVPERWEMPSAAGVPGRAEPEAASAPAGPQRQVAVPWPQAARPPTPSQRGLMPPVIVRPTPPTPLPRAPPD
jgi:hypothetical protein